MHKYTLYIFLTLSLHLRDSKADMEFILWQIFSGCCFRRDFTYTNSENKARYKAANIFLERESKPC